MDTIRFALVGSGWRAEFYRRVAHELPNRFAITGVLVRQKEAARRLEQEWGVRAFIDVDALLEYGSPQFVVICVPREAAPGLIGEFAGRGIPVLCETPPAADMEGLAELNRRWGHTRIQIAEQYPFQPLHAARLEVLQAGWLGDVRDVYVSVAHGYHGMCLLRKFLGVGIEPVVIRAWRTTSPIVAGPDRSGPPRQERIVPSAKTAALLEFTGKTGLFEFAEHQYFSWIRSPVALIRGSRGELVDMRLTYLTDFQTPVRLDLIRWNAGENGNLEGYYLKGITAGDRWLYRNPFAPARLTDDEIAVATCLERMSQYVRGGPSFYNLAEASYDHYLSLLIELAISEGKTIETDVPLWLQTA